MPEKKAVMCINMKFESLPLHDASLKTIQYEWASHEIVVYGQLSSKEPTNFVLTFNSATFLGVPQKNEWGPSVSINELETDGKFVFYIHMQSGDIISIKANEYTYETSNT